MSNDLLLQNVRVAGAAPADVLIKNGRIDQIGPGIPATQDIPTRDGHGRIALPGFMGLDDYGIDIGCSADLVLVPGQVPVEPIVALPTERTVIKAGRVVAVDGVYQ